MLKRTLSTFVVVCFLLLVSVACAQPSVRICSPQPEQCVPGPDVLVHFEASGLTISPACNNLHFMLDNDVFDVQYDATHPHLFHSVAPGTHTLRVYMANAMHEAIPGTLALVTFSVAYPDEENRLEVGEPLLTYNLPQGEYLGLDAADITVNWLVSGTCLGRKGYHVNYYVDGRRYIVYDCTTRHIQGLAPGLHTVRVELADERNNVAPGPFNAVERAIVVSPHKSLRTLEPGEPVPSQPTIESIHGAMSMSQPWVSPQPPAVVAVPPVPPSISVTAPQPRGALQHEFKVREENIDLEEQPMELAPLPTGPGAEAAPAGEEVLSKQPSEDNEQLTEMSETNQPVTMPAAGSNATLKAKGEEQTPTPLVSRLKNNTSTSSATKAMDKATSFSAIKPRKQAEPVQTVQLQAIDANTSRSKMKRVPAKTPNAKTPEFQPFPQEQPTSGTSNKAQ